MAGTWYCTREMVQGATDQTWSPREADRIDRAVAAASRVADRECLREFGPWYGTSEFDWPDQYRHAPSWKLPLYDQTLISVTSITSGGAVIPAAGYILRRSGRTGPYMSVEIQRGSSYAWESGQSTQQNAISVTGVWGYSLDSVSAGVLGEDLDLTETGVDITAVTRPDVLGTGALLIVGTELMVVTGRTMVATGQTVLSANMTASSADTLVTVTSTASITPGEILLCGAERMLVRDKTAATLIVQRAYSGTTLATHAIGAALNAPWSLTVQRASQGSTPATHLTGAPVLVWQAPELVQQFVTAHAVAAVSDMAGAYARPAGPGDARRPSTTWNGVSTARDEMVRALGRKRVC
jgi:hypothetical protein